MYRLYWQLLIRPSLGTIALLSGLQFAGPLLEVFRLTLVVPFTALLIGSADDKTQAVLDTVNKLAEYVGLESDKTSILFVLGLLLFLSVILDSGLNLLFGIVSRKMQGSIRVALVCRMFDAFMAARYQEIIRRGLAVVYQDLRSADTVARVITLVSNAASSVVLLLLLSSLLMLLSWKTTLIAAAVLIPVTLVVRRVLDGPSRSLSTDSYGLGAKRNQTLFDAVHGIKVAKMQGLREHLLELVREVETRLVKVEVKTHVISTIPKVSNEIAGMSIVLFLLAMVLYVPQFGLSLPIVVAQVLALGRIAPAATTLGRTFIQISGSYKQIEVVGEALNEMEREDHGGIELSPSYEIRDIELESLSFAYPERPSEVVVDKVSLKLRRGRVTGIVGSTGGGKTTLADLIAGIYTPSNGRILVDGTDLADIRLSSWRSRIGYVGQDTFLFSGTVWENIALWREDIEPERVRQAAKAAQIQDFIESLPNGYDTDVGDRGVKLSGGQRQRIAIARAILNRPQVFIFDEATSALDNVTEAKVHRALSELRDDAIVLIIAHRLSTLQDADEIVVMESGRIVESGRHETLLGADGVYAGLYRAREDSREPGQASKSIGST